MKDCVMPFFSLAEYEKLLNKLIYVKWKLTKDFLQGLNYALSDYKLT